jgi:hypothetical protein
MSDKYDDSAKGGYSYAEKLTMVAAGAMDPKEIGMATAEEAKLRVLGVAPPQAFLGDWMTFEASVIPINVQAHWARMDLKIVPTNPAEWEAEWAEEHKAEIRVQGILRSGSCMAQVDRTYTDPILGFAELMGKAAELLLRRYEELKKENPGHEIKTRNDLAREATEQAAAQNASVEPTAA